MDGLIDELVVDGRSVRRALPTAREPQYNVGMPSRTAGHWLATSILAIAATGEVEFERDVRPIFEAHCIACHGPVKEKGGVRFDSAAVKKNPPSLPSWK